MGSGPLRAGEVFLFMFFWPVAALYTSCMRCGLSAFFNIFSALAYQKKIKILEACRHPRLLAS